WRSPIRSKRHVDDMIRILEMSQNDYNIPTEKSSNRYIPYGSKYKGKTYIYVEGEEPDDYIGNISSSDITSSSESEYEELDINDIYPYKSPKYKTLIEVVLKPSNKTYDAENIHINNNMEDSIDTPNNKLTDNEWNELKHDFILNMLQTDNMDLPNENLSGNTTYSPPNTVDSSMEEKPFITSIQDRKLHSDSDVFSYNIVWNVPKNISSNSTDDSKYFSSDQYTGIYLINDSLNGNNNVDIYDELLKRKENELFGTKHTKNTSTNSDPISNQIDLFHKWLDRHRDMCNKRNNKEEMLNQLNDEWNKENKEHLLYTSTNDYINRINDENYNMISTNTHDGNDITFLEHLASTNIPPNDLTTQNNGSQTKYLRTNVSINIHFDENKKNNNVLT
ncbi:putative EMP1-like protein, partial [Plasmodium gaboni]